MNSEFSFKTRKANLTKLKEESFDLVIIGGGITGAGVARDAASRGMKVALVEADDFASGTSSRSSKLIHGGIRYLENLEFGLVFEALSERALLFNMAPHLVHPLRFMLPVYKNSRVGMFKMGLGMWLYDILSLFEAPEMHERLSKKESHKRAPMLSEKDLVGSFVYSDAYMDDDRLTIETLRSANNFGACCVNYVSAQGASFTGKKVSSVTCKDELSGEIFEVKGQQVISTVGPWTDDVATKLFGNWKNRLRPSKGIHLTLQRDRLPLKEAVVMVSADEKRIVFAIPRHEMVIIGTTDTDFTDDPRNVKSNREDVDYLLEIVDMYFPGAKITKEDVIASYAGVRPLVDDGSSSESKTSREHVIIDDERGVIFVSGGKYTTYRHMAEETVETALNHFSSEQRISFSHTQSKEPLNEEATVNQIQQAKVSAGSYAKEKKLNLEDVEFLVDRHGKEAFSLINKYLSQTSSQLKTPIKWQLEMLHAIDSTMCMSLKDFYLRRAPLFLSLKSHGFDYIDDLSQLMGNKLGLSDAEREQQVDALRTHYKSELAWKD